MPRNIPELTPEQEARLRPALRRADALNNALTVVLTHPSPNPEVQEDMVEELRSLSEDADATVNYFKREFGFPGY